MSAREGLYAALYLGTTCPVGTAQVVALLTGVDLSWSQNHTRFYSNGTQKPVSILKGCISYEGSFKRAYVSNFFGTIFHMGTVPMCGSISPHGSASPSILGTVHLTGGSLSQMEACNEAAVMEEHSFLIYNISFVG